MSGDFLNHLLGSLIVIPESRLGGLLFEFGNLFPQFVEVKDTSRVFPTWRSTPTAHF
jgi:hypothetical protein